VSPDAELVVLLAGLHLLGFLFAAVLLFVLMRADTASAWSPPEEEDDDGGNDRRPRPEPRGPRGGGLPLPDAVPAKVRLRGPERLGDLRPKPSRRPAREPSPAPTPALHR
jgi:hypothetical protein